MTGTELKTLNTEIRGGREMDETVFYTLLNLAKSQFERRRAWRKLIKKDTSKTATPATNYNTSIDLPADFIMTLPHRSIKLTRTDGTYLEYTEVPFEKWEEFRTGYGYFTIDHSTNHLYLSGSVDQTYTIVFPYIASSASITSSTSWVFPEEFHPALAFEVAGMDELGMDYDEINARQGNANIGRAEMVMRGAVKWDDTLQRSALGI